MHDVCNAGSHETGGHALSCELRQQDQAVQHERQAALHRLGQLHTGAATQRRATPLHANSAVAAAVKRYIPLVNSSLGMTSQL